jgi:chromosome transmission fidelity protein 18
VLRFEQNLGENSRIIDCLFLNVLSISYIDPTFDRCAAVHEWLSIADIFRSNKSQSIDFDMESKHIPTIAGAVHLLCRVEQLRHEDLIYTTRELSDGRYHMEINQAIAKKFVLGLSPQSHIGRSLHTIVTETIPYTLWILSAGEGSNSLARSTTSIELLSVDERQAFQSHIDVLRHLGVTYVVNQQYEDEETSTRELKVHWKPAKMTIEPPIDTFIQYKHLQMQIGRREIPPSVRK